MYGQVIFDDVILYCIMQCSIWVYHYPTYGDDMRSKLFVPGAEQLRKLLYVGPSGYTFGKNCSKSNENPEGITTSEETSEVVFSRG